jgi:hypothetical protein
MVQIRVEDHPLHHPRMKTRRFESAVGVLVELVGVAGRIGSQDVRMSDEEQRVPWPGGPSTGSLRHEARHVSTLAHRAA